MLTSGGAPCYSAPHVSRLFSEPATLAGVDHARIAPDTGPRLQPGVDDPQHAEADDPDGRPLHLAGVHGTQREEEAEDEKDAQREDPEQVPHGPEHAEEALQHRNPSRGDFVRIVARRPVAHNLHAFARRARRGYSRTMRKTPAASSTIPTTRAAVIVWRSTPSQPKWSTITDIVSCPAMVAATTPPAPSERTVTSTVVT